MENVNQATFSSNANRMLLENLLAGNTQLGLSTQYHPGSAYPTSDFLNGQTLPGPTKMAILPGLQNYPGLQWSDAPAGHSHAACEERTNFLISRLVSGIENLIGTLTGFNPFRNPFGDSAGQVPIQIPGQLPGYYPIPGQIPGLYPPAHKDLLQQVSGGLDKVIGWGNTIEKTMQKGSDFVGAIKDGLLGIVSTGASIFGVDKVAGLIKSGVNLFKKIF